jgi:two-component system, NtrC family, sensor histidine kinase HydH
MGTPHLRLPWILALLAVIFVALLGLRTRNTIVELEASQRERAALLADNLAATVQGVARYGPETRERITSVFEAVAGSSLIRGVALLDEGKDPILRGGTVDARWLDWARSADGVADEAGDDLAVLRPVELEAGHGRGRGMRMHDEESALPSGSYVLLLVTDASSSQGVRAHILGSNLALLVVGLALCALGVLLLRSQARNLDLRQRVALQEQRRASLESLRLLAAGLAHETRNPLGAIRGYTQLLNEETEDGRVRERTGLILEQIDRITSRLNEFLTFARRRLPKPEPVDLAALARGVVELLAADANAAQVTLAVDARVDAVIEGDRRQLQEALLNLVLNALQACRPDDRVTVRVEPDALGATLSVEDTGGGISPEDLPRVTEPYFTTREGGSGLGLAIVEGVAEAHHTTLGIVSRPGAGSRFSLYLAKELPRDE